MPRLILASASPQRKTLLGNLGLSFDVIPSTVDESQCTESLARKRAELLAVLKARDVSAKNPDAWVIGCDTLVVAQDGTLLEKPHHADEARTMLALLGGRVCAVHSGLCIVSPNGEKELSDVSTSLVGFKSLEQKDIDWWVASKLWEGRSGAFQIDGPGQLFIAHIEGDWTGIVGLPIYLFGELAQKMGMPLFEMMPHASTGLS